MILKQSTRRRTPLGFTLIELLVVVAIIALLISILLPSLNRAKQQARQLVCLTNLKSQGEAANFYASDNKGWLPRGIMGINSGREYHIYCTAILGYTGWKGEVDLVVNDQGQTKTIPGDTSLLFGPAARAKGVHPYILNAILRNWPLYHCPDWPDKTEINPDEQPGTSPMDYVASAMPIPYSERNYDRDSGGMEWDPEGDALPEDAGASDYWSESKLEMFPAHANPATLTYVTEANTSVAWKYNGNPTGPRFHHFFLGIQLPFGSTPRIADDQRHPGGLNMQFFDGHAKTFDLHQADCGYPNSHSKRLKYFSVMFEGFVE